MTEVTGTSNNIGLEYYCPIDNKTYETTGTDTSKVIASGDITDGTYLSNWQDYHTSSPSPGAPGTGDIDLALPPASGSSPAPASSGSGGSYIPPDLQQYSSYILAASQKYNVPVGLICADIEQESGGNPNAVSDTGYKGLMQSGTDSSQLDPQTSIMNGTQQLAQAYSQYGSWTTVLVVYNSGGTDPNALVPGQGSFTGGDYANEVINRWHSYPGD